MRKGFISPLLLILGAAALTALGVYLGYKVKPQNLGLSIQTQLSDTIGTFRTNVNTSLSTLDSEVAAVTSTIATYGNIVTENTPLAINKGGFGTTTIPANNQLPFGSSSLIVWKTLSVGNGLNSTTTATSVILGSAGFDSTANIVFTGSNTHAGSETFNATTTAPYLAPPGAVEMYASSTAPNGWLLADGTEYSTSTYPNLWAIIGYVYGGSTSTFRVPNLGGRFVAGPSSTLSTTIGAIGGSTSSALSVNGTLSSSGNGATAGPAGNITLSTLSFSATGIATTTPPYMILNYIIKY